MGKKTWIIFFVACLAASFSVEARVEPEADAQAQDAALKAFVSQKGYESEDEQAFNKAADYGEEACGDCMQPPPVSPVTRAVRQFEGYEKPLPASRYLIRGWLKPGAAAPHMLLEITRYNHGERISAELVRDYGAHARESLTTDTMASLRYRMGIMQVPMTQQFDALMPHRYVLSKRDLRTDDCLRVDCMQAAMDDNGEPVPPLPNATRSAYQPQPHHSAVIEDGLPELWWLPEALMQEAGLHRGLDELEVREGNSDKPDFVLRLDDRLYGQDDMHHGVLCQYDVMDDAMKDICWEVLAMPGSAPMWHRYITSGRQDITP